jgi:hypothetical protein
LGASAVTGASGAEPLSVIGSFSATSTSETLSLGGFVPLPVLTAPATNSRWDLASLSLAATKGGQAVDLTVLHIIGGDGLYDWTVVAPGHPTKLALPSLEQLAPDAALPVGSIAIEAALARIVGFDYGSLRYRQLTTKGWNAYASDTFYTQH